MVDTKIKKKIRYPWSKVSTYRHQWTYRCLYKCWVQFFVRMKLLKLTVYNKNGIIKGTLFTWVKKSSLSLWIIILTNISSPKKTNPLFSK